MQTGLFEYAEPKYIRGTCLVPNDPSIGQQYYLDSVQAYQAWDITQGDTNVVVGICDSGVQIDHDDLQGQIKIDGTEPINGLDDNNDGKIDNYRGWDFCGPTFNADYPGDNNPTITQGGGSHGTHVGGISAASTFNGLGIAGLAYKCKMMPLKCAPDNAGGSIYFGYEAIEYGALRGASIINCSWGGPGFSQYEQEVVTDATLTFGTLVVAAAGNDNSPELFYPAYYDHVLAVSALGPGNRRATFTNYNYKVRVGAPGVNILSTYFNNAYQNNSGTSMASPVVAGIAGLVRSRFPLLSPDQVAQRIRVTSDNIYNVQGNGGVAFFGKYGRGIANAYRAVTENAPGIKNLRVRVTDNNNNLFQPGDTLYITGDFINYLDNSSSNLKVTFSVVSSSTSTHITPVASTTEVILGEITTNSIKNNNNQPFKIFLKPTLPNDRVIDVRMYYSDGTYYDYDHHSITLNPTYLDVDKNNITTTLTSKGRIGFNDDGSTEGKGFQHKGRQTLYELGLMTGSAANKIANTVRNTSTGAGATHDNDYRNVTFIREVSIPSTQVYQYNNTMSDANAGAANSNVDILQRSYAWTTAGDSNYVIVKYSIRNKNATPLTNYYVGLFGDFDISVNGQQDKAGYSGAQKLGYIYNTNSGGLYAGVSVLGDANPNYYAIDNDATAADTFGVYDGFSDVEKYQGLSSGLYRLNAGVSGPKDVSMVIGSGPYTIAPNDTLHVGFAIVGGESLEEIQDAADEAQQQWPVITRIRDRHSPLVQVRIFPNPVSDYLWMDGFSSEVQLFGVDGKKVSVAVSPEGNLTRMDVRSLQPGLYLGKTSDGKVFRFSKN
jgi:serine protease